MLAVMMALAAMMLAAAPASAQNVSTSFFDRGDDLIICDFDDDDGDNFDECEDLAFIICDFDDDDGDNFDECEDVNVVRDFDFEDGIFSQETEQEAESGDVDQSFDVSQTGDNSNQTVSTQGVANTGNAQNVIDVVDAGDFGDFDNNDNDNFVICDFDNDGDDDECEDFNDGVIICDFDGDGRDDGDCEDFNHNNDGFVFCDRDRDGKDDGDDDCFVIFPPFFDFDFDFDDFNDDVVVLDSNDNNEFEFEEVGATIELSPTNTTNSHQEVNQAAATSSK